MIKQFTTRIRGIVIAKQGKKITSNNPNDFTFKMTKPTASIKKRITLEVTSTNSAPGKGLTVYKHGFGYIPQVIAATFAAQDTDPYLASKPYLLIPSTYNTFDITGDYTETFDIYADDQNIYLEATQSVVAPPMAGGGTTYIAHTYKFDVLLLMEEAK